MARRRFLDRIARRLTTEIKRTFPDVQGVRLGQDVELIGIAKDDVNYGQAIEEARKWWNESGQSYATMAL